MRDDVMILFHTPESGRQIWVNPFKVESVVEVVLRPGHSESSTPVMHDREGSTLQRWWWGLSGQSLYEFDTILRPAVPPTMGAQINMDSGDQGKVRESVNEVMERIQFAYEKDWDKTEEV